MIKFSDIQDAFDFVSSAPYGEHSAMIHKDTGRILWRSEYGDLDETSEDDWESGDAIEIPHQNDLDLDRDLVFDFARMNLPDDYDYICQIFSGRGAYGRLKDFLDSKGLLQSWYDFENKEKQEALRQWCKDNGIEISD